MLFEKNEKNIFFRAPSKTGISQETFFPDSFLKLNSLLKKINFLTNEDFSCPEAY